MDNIVVITQNVKLESLSKLRQYIKEGSETLVFSTQLIFENEAPVIEKALASKCKFVSFGDFMDDKDYELCDVAAYDESLPNVVLYYEEIKKVKNRILVDRLLKEYPCENRILVCVDLGISSDAWLSFGFKKVECDYYYHHAELRSSRLKLITRKARSAFRLLGIYYNLPIYKAEREGKKYLFYGSLNRISYRLALDFAKCSRRENVRYIFNKVLFELMGYWPQDEVIRLSTLHESGNWRFPHDERLNLKLIQDGYLPPNYTSKYLRYFGTNCEFYTWDIEGRRTFNYHQLRNRVLPFRKKLTLPRPRYPKTIRKILCVASGAGDWTAVKSRTDEDKMLEVFGKIAARHPEIEFVYRCHPVWINPDFQGVNSINRAIEYYEWLELPNLHVSSNIPNANEKRGFRLSYKRSSFEEDLKDVDIVFGEHSISMIDAAFKNILFCSVNVTERRDLFTGISEMGFPHCESEEEICSLLTSIGTQAFKNTYEDAINMYNQMTDKEK